MFVRVMIVALVLSSALMGVSAGNTLIQTDKGLVQGFTSDSGLVDEWLGIPYAAPPVGKLRLAVTQPAAPWSGVKQTTKPGQICPQIQIFGNWLGGEDCLYLNIYAPSNRSSSQPLPVFFWIYGGGWNFGDGIEFGFYDGHNLANKHNIIVVTHNYRLGPLGFMALQAAKNENPHGQVGSYGIYDQVAALQWVQTNIGSFGGNPDRVTIAGESAGAFSVCIHLTSPLSKDLFHNAILESGTCESASFFREERESFAWSSTYAKIVGCDTTQSDGDVLDCVRKLSLNEIMGPNLSRNSTTGYVPLLFPALSWGATIDHQLLTDLPLNVLQRGGINPSLKSVIMGSNRDEGTLFMGALRSAVPHMHDPFIPGDLDLLLDHFWGGNQTVNGLIRKYYPENEYANTTHLMQTVLRDYFFLCPSSRTLLSLDSWGISAFMYQFTYEGDWIENLVLGNYHSFELAFVFDNAWPMFIHPFSARDQKMADSFGYYWSNLMKYSDPNGAPSPNPNQVPWPRYNATSLQSLSLDVPSTIGNGLMKSKCEMWDSLAFYSPPVTQTALERFKRELIATE